MPNRITLSEPHSFTSIGVHTGKEATLTIHPEMTDKGCYFVRSDIGADAVVEVSPKTVIEGERATYLKSGDIMIQTPEHILSALAGLGITDCRIELDGPEVPIMDGSALPFVEAIQSKGTTELHSELSPISITEPLCVKYGPASIMAIPADTFSISYCLDYSDSIIGQQFFSLDVTPDHFAKDIAGARTFGFYSDLKPLLEKGLSQGASLDNVLVVGENDYMNEPRMKMEEVRHKILDVIGDFSILGAPLKMHLTCVASGHAVNRAMVLKIWEQIR